MWWTKRSSSLQWPIIHTWVLAIALVWCFGTVLMHARDSLNQGGDPWQQGDWLVNYAAGPVRRGFVGWIVFNTSPDNALFFVTTLALVLLGCLYLLVFVLFLHTARSSAWLMLILSPAFMLFPAMYPEAALRKELFALVAVAVVAVVVSYSLRWWWLIAGAVVFAIGVAAHEANVVALPALVYLTWVAHKQGVVSRGGMAAAQGMFAATAVVGLMPALLTKVGVEQVATMCQSWRQQGLGEELCSGALTYLAASPLDALRFVSQQYPPYFNYVPIVAVAAIPFILLRPSRYFMLVALLTAASTTPLLLLGIDYGRWIYLAVGVLSLACLGVWRVESWIPTRVPEWAALAFVLLWSLPFNEEVGQESLIYRWLSEGWGVVHHFVSQDQTLALGSQIQIGDHT